LEQPQVNHLRGTRRRGLIALVFFCLALRPGLVPAQQRETEADTNSPPESAASPPAPAGGETNSPLTDRTVYVIRTIDFNITGRSRPFALMYNGKLKKGEEITGKANLELYIHDRTQRLVNQRVLKDDARIDYTIGEAGEDGKVPVDLLVTVNDTWNLIVFPKPLWDPNTGLDITMKARDYNFFGTMNPLRVDLGYSLNQDQESNFNFLIDTDIPFQAMGFNWNINFDNELNYTWQEALGYKNTTGVSMELPFKATIFIFDVSHYITWYPKTARRYRDVYGDFFEGLVNSAEFSTSWKIPTGIKVFDYGEVTYQPKISEEIAYNPGSHNPRYFDDLIRGPTTSLSQSLGFDRVDWIGNYRKGMDVYFNTNSYFNHNREYWNNRYSVDARGYFILTDFLGMSSRLLWRQWFYNIPEKYVEDAGDVLRGILNEDIWADRMLSLNLEFPFKIFTARPSDWFNKPKMRIFNFDMYLSPMLDIAFVHLSGGLNDQPALKMYYTGGAEVLVFPEFMRSLYLRVSAGIDLEAWFKNGKLTSSEAFIGIGHFFGE
jgi:hypothetical protein